ncbi:vancomycin high temperature exclusion protein [Streptomyces gamaensis]|uniref:Vancomycin high temperature exclusion protein n=1 Tax=Streptomyces gamaensis TaxID=1763542 RepID=A0ABW0YZ89_9ACTN
MGRRLPGVGPVRALRLPRTARERRRAARWTMALCVLALLPSTWVYASASPRLREAGEVPSAPVAVVFGAGLEEDGTPSRYLAHRLDTAADLYRAGKVKVLLVTGDNSREGYDEPGAMRAYLTRRGIPDSRIVDDFAGFDTWDSCTRAVRVFGVKKAVLVSQGFHIRRALALCDAAGLEAYGVEAGGDPHDVTYYAGGAREVLASGKAVLSALVRPGPHFLGPYEPGVEQALSEAR